MRALILLALLPALAEAQGVRKLERPSLNLITNSEDLSQWNVAAGTPARSANDFTDGAGAPTCDTITDDDAASQEGYQSSIFSTTPGTYTFSCELAAGTATSAWFRVAVTGTGVTGHGTNCTFTSLPATATRFSCTATIGGSPISSAVWAVRVGNSASVTGTIHVCRCLINVGISPTAYVPTTSVARWNTAAAARKGTL